MMNGGKLLVQNKRAISMATQTLNTSTTSLRSDMSVEDVPDDAMAEENDEGDNDVFDDVTPDERGGLTPAPPTMEDEQNDEDITVEKGSYPGGHVPHNVETSTQDKNISQQTLDSGVGGITNFAYVSDTGKQPTMQEKTFTNRDIPDVFKPAENKPSAMKDSAKTEGSKKKSKSVMFTNSLTIEYLADSPEEAVELTGHSNINSIDRSTVTFKDPKIEDGIPSPRSAFLQRPDTPYQPKLTPNHMTPVKVLHNEGAETKPTVPVIKKKGVKDAVVGAPAIPWIGHANTGNTRNSDAINDKIEKRKQKIGLLLKDLVMSSNIVPRGKPKFLENNFFTEDETEERQGAKNTMFATSNFRSGGARDVTSEKILQCEVNNRDAQQKDNVFPYTSDLINFPSMSPSTTSEDLERYGAQTKKKKKGKSRDANADDDDNLLFKPRHAMLNLDAFGPDRNCFSDQDVNDSDITDLETDPESAISDTEGITSSRLIPVVRTNRTISIDAVNGLSKKSSTLDSAAASDMDTDLEVTDCEAEEEALAQKLRAPRILPGAQAAHLMNASRAASAKSRDYIPPSAAPRRRGGNQNDSRRRYLALNSLRRKAYELKQSAKNKAPSPKPVHRAQLLSYNTRKMPQVTIMSQV
ncbi:hypothetical protein EGW08_020321 [Elysia chlorotica]|uniref:Uncharacterized protein n=1 Tax=Elysia chlorotica TaxID=188477 RepID=A0A433SRN0_ELYCH|nr:hypothetical protein EGW08_020321 [Elysia chlorotica]